MQSKDIVSQSQKALSEAEVRAEEMLLQMEDETDGLRLDSPTWQDGVAVFSQRWRLRLTLAARGERLQLAPGSRVSLRFAPLSVEVDGRDRDWVQQWHDEDHSRVRVDLKRPASIRQVRCDEYERVAFHRADGDVVSEEAVDTARTDRRLSSLLVAQSLVLALSEPSPMPNKLQKRSAREVRQAQKKAQQEARQATYGDAMREDEAKQALAEALEKSRSWLSLELRGLPTSPRLKLLDAGGELLWQWQQAGAQAQAHFQAGEADIAALGAALNRALEQHDQQASPPATLELFLLAESDEPCRLTHVDLALQPRWSRNALPSASEASLSFSGEALERRTLPLQLPANTACQLSVQLHASGPEGSAGAPALPAGQQGLYLRAGQDAALAFELNTPAFNAGCALAWWPVGEAGKLHLSLHQDAGGAPGSLLAEATLQRQEQAAALWLFRWPRLPLQAGRHWWCLHCEEGEGIWLGSAGSPRLLQRQDDQPWAGVALSVLPLASALVDGSNGAPFTASLAGAVLSQQSQADSWRLRGSVSAGAADRSLVLDSSQPLLLKPVSADVDWPAALQLSTG